MLFPLQYDVGVDNNVFRPASFDEVKAKVEAQVAAAKKAAGIKDDDKAPDVQKNVFMDSGQAIGPQELTRLKAVSTDIIELDTATPVKETKKIQIIFHISSFLPHRATDSYAWKNKKGRCIAAPSFAKSV